MIQKRHKVILAEMYNKIQEELKPTETYQKTIDYFEEQRRRFLNNIEEQNYETLEKLTDILNDMYEEQSKQFFYKGFAIATAIFSEVASVE